MIDAHCISTKKNKHLFYLCLTEKKSTGNHSPKSKSKDSSSYKPHRTKDGSKSPHRAHSMGSLAGLHKFMLNILLELA
jgi:hypothetical protein